MVTVKFSDLLDGFEFANFGNSLEIGAFISLDRGTVHLTSSEVKLNEEVPEDLEISDRYIAIPHKNDLDLGRALALLFIEEALPDDYDTAVSYFRNRGAYSRFKGLLEARGIINQWHEFERNAIESALREWCREHDIQLIG